MNTYKVASLVALLTLSTLNASAATVQTPLRNTMVVVVVHDVRDTFQVEEGNIVCTPNRWLDSAYGKIRNQIVMAAGEVVRANPGAITLPDPLRVQEALEQHPEDRRRILSKYWEELHAALKPYQRKGKDDQAVVLLPVLLEQDGTFRMGETLVAFGPDYLGDAAKDTAWKAIFGKRKPVRQLGWYGVAKLSIRIRIR